MSKRKTVGSSLMKMTRGLPTEARLVAADNSGARILSIITVKGLSTRANRIPAATVGDMVICSVKKGNPKMRRQIVQAIIVRQRQRYRRPDGSWIRFYDNAAVVVNETGELRGSEVRGPVAKEAAERWPRIASAASIIV